MPIDAERLAGYIYKVLVNKHVTGVPLDGQMYINGVWGTPSDHIQFSADLPDSPWCYWQSPVYFPKVENE